MFIGPMIIYPFTFNFVLLWKTESLAVFKFFHNKTQPFVLLFVIENMFTNHFII